jgi:hypothetical protein
MRSNAFSLPRSLGAFPPPYLISLPPARRRRRSCRRTSAGAILAFGSGGMLSRLLGTLLGTRGSWRAIAGRLPVSRFNKINELRSKLKLRRRLLYPLSYGRPIAG